MFRFVPASALLALVAVAYPAAAADYGTLPDDFRAAYPADWDLSDNGDPLDFEFGVRYFYSLGATEVINGGNRYTSAATAHSLELHGRIDDNSTSTYFKAYAGYSGIMYGDHNTPSTAGDATIDSGHIGYAVADFGYLGLGSGSFGFGPFVGYQYQSEVSATAVPDQSISAAYNMLRLGLAARAEIGSKADLNAEVALIPYAGSEGSVSGGPAMNGALAGITGELMLGFHPTDSFTIRGGARALYLTDSYKTTGNTAQSLLRAGGLLELTYAF
jgi:hypothetical protein